MYTEQEREYVPAPERSPPCVKGGRGDWAAGSNERQYAGRNGTDQNIGEIPSLGRRRYTKEPSQPRKLGSSPKGRAKGTAAPVEPL